MFRQALTVLTLLCISSLPAAVVQVAAAGFDPDLLSSIQGEQAYVLDVRYGETSAPFDASGTPPDTFLTQATPLRTGADVGDSGFAAAGDAQIGYRLKPGDHDALRLQFAFERALADGTDSFQSEIAVTPGQWLVIGRTENQTNGQPTRYFYVILRLKEKSS